MQGNASKSATEDEALTTIFDEFKTCSSPEDQLKWLDTHAVVVRNLLMDAPTMAAVRGAFEHFIEEFNIAGATFDELLEVSNAWRVPTCHQIVIRKHWKQPVEGSF